MRQHIFLTALFSVLSLFCIAGSGALEFNYRSADSVAVHFSGEGLSHEEIAVGLTAGMDSEHEKFRALFRWVTHNISYNRDNRTLDLDKILARKEAVCGGYAMLLKKMSEAVGISCQYIVGYAKTETRHIVKPPLREKHAWNAVELGGTWYLVDVTWASGHYDEAGRRFTPSFDDFFYLTPPAIFSKTHLPDDDKWQLLPSPVTRRLFFHSPLLHAGAGQLGITFNGNHTGKVALDEKKLFSVEFKSEILPVSVLLACHGYSYPASVEQIGAGKYRISASLPVSKTTEVDLWVNSQAVASFIGEPK